MIQLLELIDRNLKQLLETYKEFTGKGAYNGGRHGVSEK